MEKSKVGKQERESIFPKGVRKVCCRPRLHVGVAAWGVVWLEMSER